MHHLPVPDRRSRREREVDLVSRVCDRRSGVRRSCAPSTPWRGEDVAAAAWCKPSGFKPVCLYLSAQSAFAGRGRAGRARVGLLLAEVCVSRWASDSCRSRRGDGAPVGWRSHRRRSTVSTPSTRRFINLQRRRGKSREGGARRMNHGMVIYIKRRCGTHRAAGRAPPRPCASASTRPGPCRP